MVRTANIPQCHFFTAWIALAAWLVTVGGGAIRAQERALQTRVAQPDWDEADLRDAFFLDLFSEALHGTRPASWRDALVGSVENPANKGQADGSPTVPNAARSSGFLWSRIISAETIESEVKQLKQLLDKSVTSPVRFASGDYRDAQRHFSLLAVLFAIIADYDEPSIRWRADASVARNEFARAVAVTKVHSDQAYRLAQSRLRDLADLLGGNGMVNSGAPEPADWSGFVGRDAIMQRLEEAFEGLVTPALARASSMEKSAGPLQREAQLIGAIATVLTMEGLEDAGEEDYREFCQQMRDAAKNIESAVRDRDYPRARAESGVLRNTCTQCHEIFRG